MCLMFDWSWVSYVILVFDIHPRILQFSDLTYEEFDHFDSFFVWILSRLFIGLKQRLIWLITKKKL